MRLHDLIEIFRGGVHISIPSDDVEPFNQATHHLGIVKLKKACISSVIIPVAMCLSVIRQDCFHVRVIVSYMVILFKSHINSYNLTMGILLDRFMLLYCCCLKLSLCLWRNCTTFSQRNSYCPLKLWSVKYRNRRTPGNQAYHNPIHRSPLPHL